MCTHIVLKNDGDYLVAARTMDFSFELESSMGIVPRNYPIKLAYLENTLDKHYAFLGLTRDIEGSYLFADGINEKGLTCSTLYFRDYASYSDKRDDSKEINLSAQEVVLWILANCETLEEVKEEFERMNLVEEKVGFIGQIPPLHWVVTDIEGNSITIEPLNHKFEIRENKYGVFANSPDISWHEANLRLYVGLDNHSHKAKDINGQPTKAYGMSSGGFGLPGDYTAPSRYVRAVFNKEHVNKGTTKDDAILAAMKVLNTVSIPLGVVVSDEGRRSYTQYTSYMVADNLEYYYKMYRSEELVRYSLNDYDLEGKDIIIDKVAHELKVVDGKNL